MSRGVPRHRRANANMAAEKTPGGRHARWPKGTAEQRRARLCMHTHGEDSSGQGRMRTTQVLCEHVCVCVCVCVCVWEIERESARAQVCMFFLVRAQVCMFFLVCARARVVCVCVCWVVCVLCVLCVYTCVSDFGTAMRRHSADN